MYKAVDVYLERTSARQYVGRLKKAGGKFIFEYSETYQYSENALSFGPDLPINKKTHFSLKLFPSFADRIPSRENPAYEEYCRSAGISPSEKNPFVLLAKLGRKGPSSFILAPVFEEANFSREDLKQFRKDLNLSIREFAELFDVSSATVYRIENNKSSGKNVLKRIKIYFDFPEKALAKIEHTGHKINDEKKHFVQAFLKSKSQEKLDEELINKTLLFLNKESNKYFEDSLRFCQNNNPVKSAESLRRSLEEFLRYTMKNTSELIENIKNLQKKLKENNSPSETRNIIFTVFNHLDKYFNEHSRHGDRDINESENEFLIYQTSLLLRYINKVTSQEKI